MARPMPRPAPVTTAVLFAREMCMACQLKSTIAEADFRTAAFGLREGAAIRRVPCRGPQDQRADESRGRCCECAPDRFLSRMHRRRSCFDICGGTPGIDALRTERRRAAPRVSERARWRRSAGLRRVLPRGPLLPDSL